MLYTHKYSKTYVSHFLTLSAVFFCEWGLNIAPEEWQIGHWTAAKPNGFLAWSLSQTTHTHIHTAKKQTDCREVIFSDKTCLEPYRSPFPLCPPQRRIREAVRNGYIWLVKDRESPSRQNALMGSRAGASRTLTSDCSDSLSFCWSFEVLEFSLKTCQG